ncbi:MAG: hypothetical protein NTZ18_03595 [Candidatus Komeilibacteria bacterium]|nr:hypothetical protein [Candidatus Komeilibacteria bacterium]
MIDIQNLQQLAANLAWITPVIIALVQVIKNATPESFNRYLPLISIGIGIGFGCLVVGISLTGGMIGLLLGLGATGLFELGKSTIAGK